MLRNRPFRVIGESYPTGNLFIHRPNGSVESGPFPVSTLVYDKAEYMVDEVFPRRKSPAVKYVSHKKIYPSIRNKLFARPGYFYWNGGESWSLRANGFNPLLDYNYLDALPLPSPSALDRSVFCISAYVKFTKQIKEEISLLNSAFELKDFKDLINVEAILNGVKKLGNHINLAKTNLTNVEARMKNALRKKGRKIAKKASKHYDPLPRKKGSYGVFEKPYNIPYITNNIFLFNEFALQPLISDIKALADTSKAVDKRLDFLIRNNGKTIPVYHDKETRTKNGGSWHFTPAPDIPDRDKLELDYTHEETVSLMVASGRLEINLDPLVLLRERWRSIFAAWGFNNLVADGWNAVPFTFVIDWVLPIGKWLDAFSANPYPGTFRAHSLCFSQKDSHHLNMSHSWNLSHPSNRMVDVGSIEIVQYYRRRELPIVLEDLILDDLSNDEQALAYSLLFSGTKPH